MYVQLNNDSMSISNCIKSSNLNNPQPLHLRHFTSMFCSILYTIDANVCEIQNFKCLKVLRGNNSFQLLSSQLVRTF